MPRIDPHQLLSCLTPLLAVNGGIKSSGEVIRLANLMEKYSKKLVSKCIYIQILKCTETDLLGQFMAAGGWNLVHTWLNDGVNSTNWPFVQEILEMLLLCPVDGNRLKSNHTPKIVKNLSLNLSQNGIITALSKKLVEQWLKIAHQEKQILQQQNGLNGTVNYNNVNGDNKNFINTETSMIKKENELKLTQTTENNISSNNNTVDNTIDGSPKKSSENVKYKISNKESGLVLSIKRSTSPIIEQDNTVSKAAESKSKSEHKSKSSEKDKSKKSSSSSSSSHKSSSSSKSSHRDKERSHKSSSSSSRDKNKDSLNKSSSSSKHSSSSSRDKEKDREKRKKEQEKEQAEKDKETLNFLAPLSSSKLQRIPKRLHSENSENKSDSEPSSKSAKANEVIEKKKPSISIEVRKGDKPKTVKTLNSQFRDHGLAEDPPPPPSRKLIKKTPSTPPIILPLPTSTIPSKPISPPPSKKIHLEKALETDVPERAGGVKLIKPKPMLIESTGFLDALESSTMYNKKDSKKRKRLPSGSSSTNSHSKKDDPESPKIEAKPLKFYKDTLEEHGEDEKATANGTSSSSPTKDVESNSNSGSDEKTVKEEELKSDENKEKAKSDEAVENVEDDEPEEKRPPGIGTGENGPPGIISNPNHPKRKRAKRSLRWRTDEDLIDVRYFELDENERVNVTKTFSEQKQDEHTRERMMMRSKVVELTEWHVPKLIDNVPVIIYGSKSNECIVQAERERNTLQEMFFNNRSMYDTPHEPDPEEYDSLEPQVVPLEDVTGNPDSVNDFRDVPWPASKGEQPQYISQGGFGSLFGNLNTSISIPPAPINAALNPLAGFNLSGIQPNIPQDTTGINFMGLIQQNALQTPFMQPPPLIQNNYQSNNNYQSRGSSSGNSSNYSNSSYNNNNNNRNRMGNSNNSGGGSNWIRGNATIRRGMCHQYQRTGHCQKSNCPYIHER